jgi:hypothetical protein
MFEIYGKYRGKMATYTKVAIVVKAGTFKTGLLGKV